MGLLSFLFGCGGNPYHKEKGEWYYDDRRMRTMPGEKLIVLNNRFARSASAAYYRGGEIDSANGQRFEALSDHYAKDDKQAWYCDTYRKGQEYYFMKHNRMLRIDGAEAASFTILAEDYAKDNNAVYYEGIGFPVKDVASFQVLEYGYAKDKVQAYYEQTAIVGSEATSFVVLGSHYSKDNKHVYYSALNTSEPNKLRVTTTIVKDADLSTFTLIGVGTDSADAKDKNNSYLNGKKR